MNNRLLVSAHFLGLLVLYLNILPLRVPEWRVFVFPTWEPTTDWEKLDKAVPELPDYDDLEAEKRIKSAIGDTIIDERFTPVMIFADDTFVSLGTLLKSDLEKQIVISPAHNFDEDIEYHYSFQILIPPTEEKIPINHILLPHDSHGDYVFCVAGESQAIGKVIEFEDLGYSEESYLTRAPDLSFRSLFDGRKLTSDCIKSHPTSFGERSFRTVPLEYIIGAGECGMAFVDEDGMLHHLVVANRLLPTISRITRDLGLRVPDSADFLAGLQAINLDDCMNIDSNGFFEPKTNLKQVP